MPPLNGVIHLRDIPEDNIRLLDQLIARKSLFETGLLPTPQTVAARRNDTIKAWINKTAEGERELTLAVSLPVTSDEDEKDVLRKIKEFVPPLLFQREGNHLRLVFSRTDRQTVLRWMQGNHRKFIQEY